MTKIAGWALGCLFAFASVAGAPLIGERIIDLGVRQFAPEGRVSSVPVNDGALKAIDLRSDFSTRLFEASIIALGALWAFVVASSRRRTDILGTASQHLIFISASFLFISSCYAHFFYSFLITSELSIASSADSNSDELPSLDLMEFQAVLGWQVLTLLTAIFACGTLVYLSYFIGQPPRDATPGEVA